MHPQQTDNIWNWKIVHSKESASEWCHYCCAATMVILGPATGLSMSLWQSYVSPFHDSHIINRIYPQLQFAVTQLQWIPQKMQKYCSSYTVSSRVISVTMNSMSSMTNWLHVNHPRETAWMGGRTLVSYVETENITWRIFFNT